VLTLFLFSLATIALPVALAYFDVKIRHGGWRWVIPGLMLSLGGLATASGVLHARLPYGVVKYAIVLMATSVWVWWVLRRANAKNRPSLPFAGRRLFFLAALLLLSDSLIISLRQGWHFEGVFLGEAPGYFRMPFHEDMMRNVSLVTALLRGTESPFLPGALLNYQVFWFHFAALCVSFFQPVSYYPLVLGCSLATGWVFFLSLLWFAATLRPALFSRARYLLPLLAIWLFHADIANVLVSLVKSGRLGMEADWSMTHVSYFRYLSPKFLSLLAPQHTFFFLFFVAALIFRSTKLRFASGEVAATVFAFLAGPILFLLGFPLLWWYTRPYDWKRLSLTCLVAFVGFHAVYGYPAWWIWSRPGSTGFGWLPALTWHWLTLPILPVLSCGVLGVAFLFLVYRRGKAGVREALPLFLFLVFFNFFISSPEMRRHATMIAAFFCGWLLVAKSRPWRKAEGRVWAALAVVAVAGQVYFLYSYTLRENLLKTDLPWRDYFRVNALLRERFPDVPVISAIGTDIGIAKPVVGEVATSFALSIDALTHARLDMERQTILRLEDRDRQILPYAKALGYRAVAWGPAERIIWGEKTERRFVDPRRRLAQFGEVGLYEIEDLIFEAHAKKKFSGFEESACALADTLADEGWHLEAIELYAQVIQKNTAWARAHEGIARSLEVSGLGRAAQLHKSKIKRN